MIKRGTKTETRRRWQTPHAKEGGTYPIQTRMFQPRAECPIFKAPYVFRQRLGDMTEEEAAREGGYTLAEYKRLWERINETSWDDDEVVYVVGIEYLGVNG